MNESTSNCLFETREICHGSRWGISEEKLGGKKCMHSIFCPVRNNCFPIISVESLSQNTERERERVVSSILFQTFLSISSALAKFSREIEHTFYRGTNRIGW